MIESFALCKDIMDRIMTANNIRIQKKIFVVLVVSVSAVNKTFFKTKRLHTRALYSHTVQAGKVARDF